MILNQTRPTVESSGVISEKFFGTSDLGMIFDILRSKLYSNPILAVCREITCNARDAHREVGKFDEPIYIHLPSGLEPEFKVKDFGPGISPDRMENIFINYASSTKRNDNIQCGAFGIGAKSPFAITDTFYVNTVYNGDKYQYVCYIDETHVGKLSLLGKATCAEPNGTEITIPVKPADFKFFRQWTEQACSHWDVKPIITGEPITWPVHQKIKEGKNWALLANQSYNSQTKLVIDGIEYPLELEALRKYADTGLIDAARGPLIMYFGIGELSLSANREQVYLDDRTKNEIKSRLQSIAQEIKKEVNQKIEGFSNLWDATVYFRKEMTQSFRSLGFLGPLSWKGITLSQNNYVNLNCPVYTFQRGKHSHKIGYDPNKLSRTIVSSVDFIENNQVIINDVGIKEPTSNHVKKAFENDPKLNHLQVICPNDKQSEDDLNKKYYFDKMQFKRLSNFTKVRPRASSPLTSTQFTSRLIVFKYEKNFGGFRQISYDKLKEDNNVKVLCLLNRSYNYTDVFRMPIYQGNKNLRPAVLTSLQEKHPNVSFYGVDKDTDQKRIEKEFSKFQTLDKFIDDRVLNNKSIDYLAIRFAETYSSCIDHRMVEELPKLRPLISDKKSFFLTRLELHEKLHKLHEADRNLLNMYETIKGQIKDTDLKKFKKDNPDWDIEAGNKQYFQKYPLLQLISSYGLVQQLKPLAQYVNMMDKI